MKINGAQNILLQPKAISALFFLFFGGSISTWASNYIVDGYMNKISYNPGDTAEVFINSDSVYTNKRLYLYTVNHLIADSAMAELSPQSITPLDPWENGYGYSVSFKYLIPAVMKSGMYNWEDKIFFIVKSANKDADITIVYPSNTEAAYNDAGGKSLYDFNSTDATRSHIVSFLRPQTKANVDAVKVLSDGFMKWFNTLNGYSVQYISDLDMDDYSEVVGTKIIAIIGHSEYWTRLARLNFDHFVNSGGDAVILSGNTMWWQVRYNKDESQLKDKSQLICYKNTLIDPVGNNLLKAIQWPTPSLHYPVLNSIGIDWQHRALPQPDFHGYFGYKVMLPNSPLLEGTGLNLNDTIACRSREYDATLFSGFDNQGNPVLDTTSLGFCKIELIGYDWGYNTADPNTNQKGYGTFIAFKKNPSSGNIINTGFNGWCSDVEPEFPGGFGGADSNKIKQITLNMFDLLLAHDNIYAKPVVIGCLSASAPCDDALAIKNQFIIFPNPSAGKFMVQSLQFGMQSLEGYNMFGEKAFNFSTPPSQFSSEIDLSFRPNGIYLLKITTDCGTSIQKLIINN